MHTLPIGAVVHATATSTNTRAMTVCGSLFGAFPSCIMLLQLVGCMPPVFLAARVPACCLNAGLAAWRLQMPLCMMLCMHGWQAWWPAAHAQPFAKSYAALCSGAFQCQCLQCMNDRHTAPHRTAHRLPKWCLPCPQWRRPCQMNVVGANRTGLACYSRSGVSRGTPPPPKQMGLTVFVFTSG